MRPGVKAIMRCLPALLGLLLAGTTHAQTTADSSAQGVTLSTAIVSGAEHTPSLRLSLRNAAERPVTILTGVMTGGTTHPATAFRFILEFENRRQVKLFCTNSSCGPMVVAGSLGPYTITLAPQHVFNIEIPLADFRIIEGGQGLCTRETEGARLIATLIGCQSPWMGSNSGTQNSYWTGTVSEGVPLTCQASGKK